MANIYALIHKWFETFTIKKFVYSTICVLLLIALINVIRGCSLQNSSHPTYRVGRNTQWFSLNLMGKDRNLTAFSDELLLTIAKREKLNIKLFSDFPNELLTKLEEGELDGIFSPLEPNFRSEATFSFSQPYFFLGPVLIVPKNSTLKNQEELSQKIIGVQTNLSNSLNLEKDSSIRVRLYDNILQALTDLDMNRIDGVIFSALPAFIYTQTFYSNRLRIATTPLTDEGLRLIALKNVKGEQLIKHFNEGLDKLKKDGTYDQLLDKWGLINTEKIEE